MYLHTPQTGGARFDTNAAKLATFSAMSSIQDDDEFSLSTTVGDQLLYPLVEAILGFPGIGNQEQGLDSKVKFVFEDIRDVLKLSLDILSLHFILFHFQTRELGVDWL